MNDLEKKVESIISLCCAGNGVITPKEATTAIRSYYLSILPEKITIDNQDDYDDETNDEELYRFGWCAAIDEMKKRIGG